MTVWDEIAGLLVWVFVSGVEFLGLLVGFVDIVVWVGRRCCELYVI